MNRTLKYALGAVLGLGLVMPATAQNFPDIPDNHWAYEALSNLRGKVLFGYPDGLYRPARPMSRAEFAVAVNQLYQMMMAGHSSMTSAMNGLDSRVSDLEKRPTGGGDEAAIASIRRQLADLTNTVNGMKGWGQDIASLKRLAGEFEKELAGVGVDVDAMKKDMGDLADRVAALEAGGDAVQISGDGNFVILAGHSTDGMYGLTKAGRLTGVGRDDYTGTPVGMTRDLSVFHELNLTLSGDAGDNVAWNASINVNNMMGGNAFMDYNAQNAGVGFREEWADVFIDEMSVSWDDSLAGQGFSADVGRFRHSSGPFFMSRSDYTEFYNNSRWDDGDFVMDGGRFMFGFGTVDLTVLMARNSERYTVGGFDINPMSKTDGGGNVFTTDQMMGFELDFDLGEDASLTGVYYLQDTNTMFNGANRMNTFGAEVEFSFNDIDLMGVFAQTDFSMNTNSVINSDNTATALWASYDGGNWGLNGGYASVEGNFGANGAWGRIGTAWNPSNIQGYAVGLWFQASEDLSLSLNGGFWEGNDSGQGLFGLPLTSDDEVKTMSVKLAYDLNEAWGLSLGYENVDWDFNAGTDPEQKWYTVGLNYSLSDATEVSFLYMISDVDFMGRANLDPAGMDVYKGGMLGTQVSFKF